MVTETSAAKPQTNHASLPEHQRALHTILQEFDRVCRILEIPYMLFAGTMLGAVRHEGFIPWDDDVDVIMMRKDYDRFLEQADAVLQRDSFFLQKEFSEHWPMFFSKLRLNHTTCLEKYHPRDPQTHQGVYIDIFPCDNAMGHPLGRKLQFCASKVVIAKSLKKRGYETDSIRKKMFMNVCTLLPLSPFLKLTKCGREDSEYVHSFLGGASAYSRSVYPRRCMKYTIYNKYEGNNYPIPKEFDTLLTIMYGDYRRLPPPEERVIKQHAILVDLENSYEMYRDYRNDMTFDIHTKSIR
jgi:lipopolysaccharide cholinephosphotransferase